MRSFTKAVALALGVTLAAPAIADEASDTVQEDKAKIRKGARDLKPGDKSASDRMEDAKDTASEKAAQGRKKARKGKKKAKSTARDATR